MGAIKTLVFRIPPRKAAAALLALAASLLLCQCETLETAETEGYDGGTIKVEGRLDFPDGLGITYIIPTGAEVVGAGGVNCTYIVETGGRLEAHAGTNNTYRIGDGGYFKGFNHPSENCVVYFSPQATIEQVETGPGTRFQMTQ